MTDILIIETDEPPLRLLAWGLREEGLNVATVAGPDAASTTPKPTAVIMNTHMEAGEKRLWIGSIRYLLPGVVVLDLAANGDPVLSDSGADAYIYPPARVDQILDVIGKLTSPGAISAAPEGAN